MFRPVGSLSVLLWRAAHRAAQTFPSKPVHLIVPQLAAARQDVMARMLADGSGQNGGRASSSRTSRQRNIGTEAVIRAAPDGYRC